MRCSSVIHDRQHVALHGRLSPKPQTEEEAQQPSTPLVSSSWQQLPDGFLALALADEHSTLSSRSSLSEGTAHADGAGHASPAATDDEDTTPELPVLHLQVQWHPLQEDARSMRWSQHAELFNSTVPSAHRNVSCSMHPFSRCYKQAHGGQGGCSSGRHHLQEGEGPCQLLPLRAGGMLVLLLLRQHVGVGRAMRAQLAGAVAAVLPSLAAQVANEVDSANGWHVKGFRCAYSLHPLLHRCWLTPAAVHVSSPPTLLPS